MRKDVPHPHSLSADAAAGNKGAKPGLLSASICDFQEFIRANLPLLSVASIPEIRLHQAGPASGLWRLAKGLGSPYFAYPWSGGLALARHLLDRRGLVADRRVLDLGAGSGLVAIAAARAGAAEVTAADVDPRAIAATLLNARANGVRIATLLGDPTAGPALQADVVTVGDLFYERALASRVIVYLDRCLEAGAEVLVGDPGRAFLPARRLGLLARYEVAGFGDSTRPPFVTGSVFALQRDRGRRS